MKQLHILIFFIFISASVHCQYKEIKFDRITPNDGLLHSNINLIYQDSKGFMWFGTNFGLNRYDGYNYRVFKNVKTDSTTLSNNVVLCITGDSQGNIWVGTEGGVNIYNPEKESFTRFTDGHFLETNIISLFIQNDSTIWFGSFGGGLTLYNSKQGTFLNYKNESRNKNSLVDNRITKITGDSDNTIWIATFGGLSKLNPESQTFTNFKIDENDEFSLSSNKINDILTESDKFLWIATEETGLDRLDLKTGIINHYQNNQDNNQSISDNTVKSLMIDNKGVLWVGTYNGGLNIYDKESNSFRTLRYDILNENSIGSDAVYDIYQDKSGIIWLATWGSGVDKFDIYNNKFYALRKIPNKTNSLSGNIVMSILEDSESYLWIGTRGEGLNKYNKKTKKYTHYKSDRNNRYTLSNNTVFSLFEDSEGDIWVGTDHGINRFNKKTGNFTFLVDDTEKNKSSNSIYTNAFFSITQDKQGNLWFGGWETGLIKYNKNNHEFTTYYQDSGNPVSIPDNTIWNIFIDSKDTLWVCTKNGVGTFNTLTETYWNLEAKSGTLPGNEAGFIYEDKNGIYWISNYGYGLSRYDRNKNTIHSYSQKDGLPDNNILGIAEDRFGKLWLSTNRGLSSFDKVQKEFRNYNQNDGLLSNEFSHGSYFKSEKDEYVYFGGTKGLNYFNPAEIVENPNKPSLVLVNLSVSGEKITAGDTINGEVILKKSITYSDSITYHFRQKILAIEFSSTQFSNPERNNYAYKLEGFDTYWHQADASRRIATYTNLDPGTYTFYLKGTNPDGIWSDKPLELTITVTPPFWKTWWYRTVLTILIAFFTFLAFRLRYNYIINNRQKLLSRVREKTKDLKKLNIELSHRNNKLTSQNDQILSQKEEIQTQNEALEKYKYHLEELVDKRTAELKKALVKAEESDRLKTSFLANISHEIRTPLNSIVGLSNMVFDDDLTDENKEEYVSIINSSNESLVCLIDDVLDFSLIESNLLKTIFEPVNINTEILQIYHEYKIHYSEPQIEFILDNQVQKENLTINSDKYRIKQVLGNLLRNAFKFTERGYVKLGVKREDNNLIFYVSDSGIGISEKNLEIIFDRFRKIEDNINKLYRGAGLGLAIAKKISQLLKGKIWVESELGKGANFYLSLPLSVTKRSAPQVNKYSFEQTNWKNKKVLIVEDEESNQFYLRKLLEHTGIEISNVYNGKSAVDLVSRQNFDLILMDIKMPVMDGYKALELIKKNKPEQIIIAQTAYATGVDENIIHKAGFDSYLKKPVKKAELYALMNRYFLQY